MYDNIKFARLRKFCSYNSSDLYGIRLTLTIINLLLTGDCICDTRTCTSIGSVYSISLLASNSERKKIDERI